jgi:glutathione S-transferase
VAVKLYVIPGSHPSKAAELMLEHKGIPFKRVDLVTSVHRPALKLLGFERKTVPAMKADGRKVQGTREISRALDEIKPEPPLLTSDAVKEAERWGDEELQPIPRRMAWWALLQLSGRQRTEAARLSLQGYRLGLPVGVAARTVLPIAKVSAGYNNSTDENIRADLAAVPDGIDRVDALIGDGVIDGEQLNAADFQIATSVRLMLAFEDLQPYIEGRPAAKHARRVVPDYAAAFRRCSPPSGCLAARRLELSPHQRVPAARRQDLPHAQQHAGARGDRVTRSRAAPRDRSLDPLRDRPRVRCGTGLVRARGPRGDHLVELRVGAVGR